MTATPTYDPGQRVRLKVPDTYHDHEGKACRLSVTLVFRVIEQHGSTVRVQSETTSRRFVLPAHKLTRVG